MSLGRIATWLYIDVFGESILDRESESQYPIHRKVSNICLASHVTVGAQNKTQKGRLREVIFDMARLWFVDAPLAGFLPLPRINDLPDDFLTSPVKESRP